MKTLTRAFAVTSALALVLAGCGTEGAEPDATSPTTPASTTTTEQPDVQVHDLDVGESVTWEGWTFRVDEAGHTSACPVHGATAESGSSYLVVSGEVSTDKEGAFPLAESTLAVQVEGNDTPTDTIELAEEADCLPPTVGVEAWGDLNGPGDELAFRSVFSAPADAEYLLVYSPTNEEAWRVELGEYVPVTEAESEASPATEEPVAPTLVECMFAGGSWTSQGHMSDGSIQEHPECLAQREAFIAENPYRCPRTDNQVPDPSHCLPAPEPQESQVPRQPSPWVQGQIDMENCLAGGNTHDFCREALN